jgi:hypothetical protein
VLGFQSALAWELDMNVGEVGFHPGRSIRRGLPVVVFKPRHLGWQVLPIHYPRAQRARCAALKAATDS